eukprot:TRINITY_DN5719_c0_g1_i14.p1 TRINITY_DN5719_c0_g1~~TRINITY_DN5719_c0_g1_i14.p1  ORF type:complete len:308 (-),score=42.37 TRINITY_DN5719_c0_g1_i14:2460-3383(-)
MGFLNPYASDFIPLQVKATSTQKSVEFLCNRTGLEALVVGLEVHQNGQSTSLTEEEAAKDMYKLKQEHTKISGVWSQVQGLQSLSHAKLYLQDSEAIHREAKLTNFDSMNLALLQIFEDQIPVVMKHVSHEFFYEIVREQLYYGVELSFAMDDGVNHVRSSSIYGFSDALMKVYDKFIRRVCSWGYKLEEGCTEPILPKHKMLSKYTVLEMAGIYKKTYTKEQLLEIASETAANAALVNDITSKLIPWDLGREDSKVVEIPFSMAPVWSMPLQRVESETYNPTDLCALLKSESSAVTQTVPLTLCAS